MRDMVSVIVWTAAVAGMAATGWLLGTLLESLLGALG